MITGSIASSHDTRRRRRKTLLPAAVSVMDSILIVVLALVPIGVIWVFGGNRFWIMAPSILLILAGLLLFLYRYFWSASACDLVVPPGGRLLLVFLGYLAVTLPWMEIPYDGWLEIVRFISYVAMYWMWVNLLRYNKRWKWVLLVLMLSVSIMAWYALIQNVHGTNMVLNRERPEQYGMRASGAFICPNHFANLLEMMIPIAFGVMLYRGADIPMRLVAGYTALVCLPALYLTESRSGWIGLLTGTVVFAVAAALAKGTRRFLLMLLIAPLLAGALGASVWMLSPRVQARVEAAIRGDIRIPLWKDSLPIAQEQPVLGSGLGTYRWKYPHYRDHYRTNNDPEFAHNDYLHFWIEVGAVGVLIMAVVAFLVVRRAVRHIRRSGGDDTMLMAGMLGAMIGALAHAFFDFNFHIFGNVQVFAFLVAVMVAATHDKQVDPTLEPSGKTARIAGTAAMLAVAGVMAGYAASTVSYFQVMSAGKLVENLKWDEARVKYETALAWSPANWRAHIGLAHLLRTRSFWMRDPDTKRAWLDEARHHYGLAGEMNPWEADVLFGLASVARMEGDDEEALRLRRLTVEMVPFQPYYLNELGLQLRRMGYYAEALEVFQESRSVEKTVAAERNIAWLKKRIAAGAAPR